jgi:hypothetical protein
MAYFSSTHRSVEIFLLNSALKMDLGRRTAISILLIFHYTIKW